MAFIEYRSPENIPPVHRVPDGDNILRIHGVHPEALSLHYALYRELMYGASPLSRVQREMIAVTVSRVNRCRYCLLHHGGNLRAQLRAEGAGEGEAQALFNALAEDHRTADVSPPDLAMLHYAAKVAGLPSEITDADVLALRTVGFDDRGVHDICAIASYFAFVNRIALGLGVELEARFLP